MEPIIHLLLSLANERSNVDHCYCAKFTEIEINNRPKIAAVFCDNMPRRSRNKRVNL